MAHEYLADLNTEQRHAVELGIDAECATTAPPLLVIAGAGSGKTKTLGSVKSRRLSARGKASNTNLSLAKPSRSPRANAAIPSRRSRNSTNVALRLRRAS